MTRRNRKATVAAAVNRGAGSGTTKTGNDGATSSDALLDSVAAPTAQDVQQVQQDAAHSIDRLPRYPLEKICPHPFNPVARMDVDNDLIDLGKNIAEQGLQQPIVLAERSRVEHDDPSAAQLLPERAEWVLIAGHRRYGAADNADVPDLPGLLRTGLCTPEAIAGIFNDENTRRRAPSPLMLAETYARMQEADMSTTQIGHRVGVSQPQVSKTLKLLPLAKWEEAAREMHAGRLTRDDAFALLDLPEDARPEVFGAWQADRDAGSDSPLRTHARRHTRKAAQEAIGTVETASTEETSASGEIVSNNGNQGGTRDVTDTVAAVIAANPTATIRADILSDAALYVDDSTTKAMRWRQVAEHALARQLPKRGELPELDQRNRRMLAVARGVALLEASAEQHRDDAHQPSHVQRHHERLRSLGVL